jgi:GDP-mannose pyrophosphatase NudK
MESTNNRIRIREVRLLSDDWYVLKKTTFDYRRRDGTWQTVSRETYDRGNGATILLYNRRKRTILLTRQFRYPAYVNGLVDGMLVEACAGLLDSDDPVEAIKRETEEETGYRINRVTRLFEAYMSPGSVTEKLHFFAAEYEAGSARSAGGGSEADGEEIETVELELAQALAMIATGHIQDGKTIMLIQYAALTDLFGNKPAA